MSLLKTLSHSHILRAALNWQPADEFRLLLAERELFLNEAKHRFAAEQPEHGSLRDYRRALRRHRVTYSEYMYSYEFWRLNETERDQFISTSEVQCIYRKAGDAEVRRIFHNKPLFLSTFQPFVQRKWVEVARISFEEFREMVLQSDCVAKPTEGTRGAGIEKVHYQDDDALKSLYKRYAEDGYLLEECVQACTETAAFHPQSLNTIRVVTISNQDRCEIFGALFRMGAHGSFIDNTHGGGIYAPINVETGEVMTDGIDAQNRHYAVHPDTGVSIKGFVIPHWADILATCRRASQQIPNIRVAGWDLCVLPDGTIEIIEGNHAPDFDGGMQAPLKTGVKYRFRQVVKEVLGFDPLPLISIFGQTKKRG